MPASKDLAAIRQMLKLRGCKMTLPRVAILRVFMENSKENLSSEEIYAKVKLIYPEIGIATVYRNVELFSKLRITEKMTFDPLVTRYTLRRKEHSLHSMVCSQCKRIQVLEEDWLGEMEERLQQQYGFRVVDHQLVFSGFYLNCDEAYCRKQI